MKFLEISSYTTLVLAFIIVAGCSGSDTGSDANGSGSIYQAAVADSRRPAEDTARDAGRKPAEVLQFFGVAPGQTVLDISSGSGYFTRVISGIVGDGGTVIANNSGGRVDDEFKADLQQQYSTYNNVELNYEAPEDISLPDNSVDVVLLSLVVHHWHYADGSGEFVPDFALERYDNIYRMLKPGGIFAIIEHEATPGMSRQVSDEIHRIPRDIAVADITLAGFELDAESYLHKNPGDDMSVRWGREPRDVTQRIVQRYRKPVN